jgi:hypothetical protein
MANQQKELELEALYDECYAVGLAYAMAGNKKLPKDFELHGKTYRVLRSTGLPGVFFVRGWKAYAK